jgi:hypothetical protein
MMEVSESIRKTFGISPKPKEASPDPGPRAITTEPWMADFVKGRHSQGEWDDFFAYCEAGPVKRRLIKMASFLYFALIGNPRQSDER